MAALHIYLAETEAKRGLLRNARRHLHIGRRGLSGFSNRWLEALAENVESAIETMASDFAAALTHAWKCLELARDAGAASVQESALGNLGNLSLVASRFDDANDCLNRARAARRGSDNWTACMETSARIYLAQGQLSDCARILDEIDNAVAPSNQSQYVYRHTQLTRVHLLGRMNQVDEALRHSDFVLKLAELSGDHLLSDLTVLTKAELLQESNRTADSVSLLQSLVSALPSRSPDFFAQYERVLACATLRAGHPELAEQHRKRSSRVYLGLRHEAGQLELSRGWTKAGGHRPALEVHPNATRGLSIVSLVLGDIASVLLHAGRSELVAREILALLEAADCVNGATAVARAADGSSETLAHIGPQHDPPAAGRQCLAVGTDRERSIDVLIDPKTDLESIATINSVVLLLATLHELERGRAEREERATLWPVDELPADADGAVTVGHMRDIMTLAKRVANTRASVLITGESGTGKEIVARAIHAHSSRASKPFLPFNCAAVPRELLESQLFGYRRGAFTGADRDNPGRDSKRARRHALPRRDRRDEPRPAAEAAQISRIRRNLSARRVHALPGERAHRRRHQREPRGSGPGRHVFARIYFYRLNVIRLSLKPLRERRDEVPALISHFLIRATEEFGKSHIRIAEETMERLILYAWPGNVRQLQNEVRRIVAMADPGTILQPAGPVRRDSADHVRGNSGFGETQSGECGHVARREAHSRPVTHRTRNDHDGAARSSRQGGSGRAGARHLTQRDST